MLVLWAKGTPGSSRFPLALSSPNGKCDCHSPWLQPRRTGDSGGYSTCMIPSDETTGGGVDLNGFYIDNRVIDGDQFRVRVI